jgi:hypothetical protein
LLERDTAHGRHFVVVTKRPRKELGRRARVLRV